MWSKFTLNWAKNYPINYNFYKQFKQKHASDKKKTYFNVIEYIYNILLWNRIFISKCDNRFFCLENLRSIFGYSQPFFLMHSKTGIFIRIIYAYTHMLSVCIIENVLYLNVKVKFSLSISLQISTRVSVKNISFIDFR